MKDVLLGSQMEDKIRKLEQERDYILSITEDKRLSKNSTIHSRIKCFYNRRISMLKKYGVEYALQLKQVRDKINETNQKKYGCNSILGNKEFREKYDINTNFQKLEVRRKTKQTSIMKYRVSHPQKSPIIKIKIRRTNLLRYGTPNGKGKRKCYENK